MSDDRSTNGIETQRYEITNDGERITVCEMKDTPEWSPYEPCPHCGGERFRNLEIGEAVVYTTDGEIGDFGHNDHQDTIEVACDECGETLWRHMAVQLISKFSYRPF